MVFFEILAVLGVGGTIFGAYQYIKTKRRLDRREELESLADDLQNINARLKYVRDGFREPDFWRQDLINQLDLITKEVITYHFENDEIPNIILAGTVEEDHFRSGQDALRQYKNGDWVSLYLTLEPDPEKSRLNFPIGEHIMSAARIYETLEDLRDNEMGVIEEFEPGLLGDVEDVVDSIIKQSYDHALSKGDGVQIDPETYDLADDIGYDVYREFLFYDGYQDDIEELDIVIERIEETRKSILQAIYP